MFAPPPTARPVGCLPAYKMEYNSLKRKQVCFRYFFGKKIAGLMSWSKDSCLKIICEAYNRTFCSPIDGLINISPPDQELKNLSPTKSLPPRTLILELPLFYNFNTLDIHNTNTHALIKHSLKFT